MKNIVLGFILTLLCLTSCKVLQLQTDDIEELIIYPPPPDKVRIQYLTSINNEEDIKGKSSGRFITFLFGEQTQAEFADPMEITSTENQLIFCDGTIKGFQLIDLKKKTIENFVPKGRGSLIEPTSCTLDSAGNLYVADTKRKQVVVFSKTNGDYTYKDAFGDTVDYVPYDILAFKGKLWVANTKTRKIHVYDGKNHDPLFTFPNVERQDSGFIVMPRYLEGFEDNIYVTDFIENKIKVYDLNGNFLRSVGSRGTFPGQFARAKDLALDKDENLFVVDAAFGNVQIFNKEGQLLMFFGGQNNNSGDMIMPRAIHITDEHNSFFESYLDPSYNLKYIIYISNQMSINKVNVYGFIETNDSSSIE
jgi:DNA-binding beta-propeller fold protein YncE